MSEADDRYSEDTVPWQIGQARQIASQSPEPSGDRTPWAPPELGDFRCICRSPDARDCKRIRYHDEEEDEPCECACHDRSEFDEEEWL